MSKWATHVYYDESSPSCLRWAVDRGNGIRVGDVVGTFDKQGRWSFVLTAFGEKKRRYCHRIIWELFNSDIPEGKVVDHIDGNQGNNVLANLRVVDYKINHRNTKRSPRNTTGLHGVAYHVVECKSGSYAYWVASWKALNGKQHFRHFSVLKLGEDAAKLAAIQCRKDAIAQLNAEGAGYSERHGT